MPFSVALLTCAYIVRVFRKMLFDSRATKVREPPVKESKLKALLKRSSEPFMGIQISQQVDLNQYLGPGQFSNFSEIKTSS